MIFDNDGVLVDSERLANQVLARLLTELGTPTTFEESVATYLGGTIGRVRAQVEQVRDHPLPDDFEDRFHRDLFASFETGLRAVPGAADVLDRLERAGEMFCVASSGSAERIARSLGQVGLLDRFGGRVYSADSVAHGKPAPDLFLHTASSLGVEPADAVVIEDSPLGVEAARAAGMRVVGFAAVTPAGRLTGAGADVVATDMAEVGRLLGLGSGSGRPGS